MFAPSDTKYSAFGIAYHERSIGKRLKIFNVKYRYKTAEISYDGIMSTGKKYAGVRALLIFFIMCFASHAQNARGPKNALPYRGMRMSEWDGLFYVTKIESEREENDLIEIEIKFNIPADPRTLRNELIRIDGNRCRPTCASFSIKRARK